MQWFRLHTKLLNDPVVQSLNSDEFKTYINLLCYAATLDKGGYVGTINETAFALRETIENVSLRFKAFQGVGLIVTSVTDSETFQIPQWSKKQYKSDTSTSRVKKHREKVKRSKTVTVTAPDTDTDTDTEEDKNTPASPPNCPSQDILNLYHKILPTLPKVKIFSDQRKRTLRARWKQDPKHQSLNFWERYFKYIAKSNFLVNDMKNAGFDWFINSSNFIKIIEGKYHE